ncbi:hypothetical protein Ancab_032756 [Ancistrocladus abbreviatus]
MQIGVNNHRMRHHHHRNRHHHRDKDKGPEIDRVNLGDPSPMSPDHHHPASASSLRRHVAESLMRHHQSTERSNRALHPLSPASCGSSLEMAPYKPAVTPTSSIELKGKIGDASYSLKTSTELLKVLNRIWSLEEQHQANASLVKALKIELDHARARIKELLRDQQASRHAIDELMKQITDDKLARKSKEQERIDTALQSARDELEDERKLRRRSETLHRKLAKDLFEVKVVLSSTLKELEKERRSHQLVEELCDEFARGIRGLARQVHSMKPKSDKDWTGIDESDDLILHISESWLDERMQMKGGEAQGNVSEKTSAVDRLRHEIEAFLYTKQVNTPRTNNKMSPGEHNPSRLRRQSVESIRLNDGGSAPQCAGNEDSALCDACSFEINKRGDVFDSHEGDATESPLDQKMKSSDARKMVHSNERKIGRSPLNLQVKFEEQLDQDADTTHRNLVKATDSEIKALEGDPCENGNAAQEGTYQLEKEHDVVQGLNTSNSDRLISELLVSEGGSFDPGNGCRGVGCLNPTMKRNKSPMRRWMMSVASPDLEISESSSKMQPVSRENTLKAKMQEGRPRGQRLKILKGSS